MPRSRSLARSSVFATARRSIAVALSVSLPGCAAVVVDTAPDHTVNMDHWNLRTLQLGLRQDESAAICPGAVVQVAISGDARPKKRGKPKRLETWSGDPQSADRMHKMSFDEFAFVVAGGTIDENGFFTAKGDPIETAITGFDIAATYKRDGGKLKVATHYPPSYACVLAAGMSGVAGENGMGGAPGYDGEADPAGGVGGSGSAGGQASDGGPGGDGPTIVAYATMVRTPHHPELGLLRVTGDAEHTLLFDPKRPLVLTAGGGAGGAGGPGGPGGHGGPGGAGSSGGNGGPGGNGGSGGPGGPGGSVVLVFDAKFPALAELIRLDANGGPGGAGGQAGPGGNGGHGGAGEGGGAQAAPDGAAGVAGNLGAHGLDGAAGVVQAQPGDVASVFADLPAEIVRL